MLSPKVANGKLWRAAQACGTPDAERAFEMKRGSPFGGTKTRHWCGHVFFFFFFLPGGGGRSPSFKSFRSVRAEPLCRRAARNRYDNLASPELAPLFFFCFCCFGVFLFSTHQAKQLIFCRGPNSSLLVSKIREHDFTTDLHRGAIYCQPVYGPGRCIQYQEHAESVLNLHSKLDPPKNTQANRRESGV